MQYQTACELACNFPEYLADFIEIETCIRNGRFREETLTDLFLVAMLRLPGMPLELIVPKDESQVGSDLDIVLVDLYSRKKVGYRIQAKRLSLGAKNWDRNSYRELAHPKNSGKQYNALVSSSKADNFTPLYAFYNPTSICAISGNTIRGVELAYAGSVGINIADIVSKAGGGKSTARQIRNLSKAFFPLEVLFCPPDKAKGEGRGIATPEESAREVSNAIQRRILSYPATPAGGSDGGWILPKVQEISQPDFVHLHGLRRTGERRTADIVRRADVGRLQIVINATEQSKLATLD